MKSATRLGGVVLLLSGVTLSGCASHKPPQAAPAQARGTPPPSAEEQREQLVRTLERLKQPGIRAEQDTDEARSVLEAIGGSAEMQGSDADADAGLTDH